MSINKHLRRAAQAVDREAWLESPPSGYKATLPRGLDPSEVEERWRSSVISRRSKSVLIAQRVLNTIVEGQRVGAGLTARREDDA